MKDNMNFSKSMISCKMMTKILCGNFEKSFSNGKNRLKKIIRYFLHANYFMFLFSCYNFLMFVSFLKAETALAKAAGAVSASWKTHSCKLIIPSWARGSLITYTNYTPLGSFTVTNNYVIRSQFLCVIVSPLWMLKMVKLKLVFKADNKLFKEFTFSCHKPRQCTLPSKWIEKLSFQEFLADKSK